MRRRDVLRRARGTQVLVHIVGRVQPELTWCSKPTIRRAVFRHGQFRQLSRRKASYGRADSHVAVEMTALEDHAGKVAPGSAEVRGARALDDGVVNHEPIRVIGRPAGRRDETAAYGLKRLSTRTRSVQCLRTLMTEFCIHTL